MFLLMLLFVEKNDPLLGLKENVIIGKIIPAGTGMPVYREMEPKVDIPEDEKKSQFIL